MKIKSISMMVGLAFALVVIGCDSSSDNGDVISVDENGNTSVDIQALSEELNPAVTGLTSEDAAGLIFMKEEEKLARDTYLALYDVWNLSIFQNISNSEQTHTDAVGVLLDQYGIADPSSSNEAGEFTDAKLQNLYNQLVAQGSISLSDALKVGATIEEIDIIDLSEYIAETDVNNIILVYENLMKGSRNHLRSFVATLENQTGETYVPQYLSQEEYDLIIDSSFESGR